MSGHSRRETGNGLALLVVRVGDDLLAVKADEVREVVSGVEVADLEHAPAGVSGLARVRDRMVTVMDAGGMLGGRRSGDRGCLVVGSTTWGEAGIMVDQALELVTVDIESVVPAQGNVSADMERFFICAAKWEQVVVPVLDLDELPRSGSGAGDGFPEGGQAPDGGVLRKAVAFELGDRLFCADVPEAVEILRAGRVTPLPGGASHVLGLMNVRGSAVPVLDPCQALGTEARESGGEAAMILVKSGQMEAVVAVDRAWELIRIDNAPEISDQVDMEKMIKGKTSLLGREMAVVDVHVFLTRTSPASSGGLI